MIRLRGLRDLDEARASWTELARGTANVFSTWEWAEIWWRHFGAGSTLSLSELTDGARTVAILPLHTSRRYGLQISRFLGHGVADQLGPVCERAHAAAAMAGLRWTLRDTDVLLAERMAADQDSALALGGEVVNVNSSPVIDLAQEGDWEAYLRSRSSNFRQQARRRMRRIQGALGVRFRLTDDASRLDGDFDRLLALHDARWGVETTEFRAHEAFHREFAACALERGWLRLWLAEAEGVPVAAWYGFRYGGVESYYQAGRDPAWDRYSVGAGILEHSIRESFADGMREYRLLRGDEGYKRRYETRDPGVHTVAGARRPVGKLAVASVRLLANAELGRRLLRPLTRRALTG